MLCSRCGYPIEDGTTRQINYHTGEECHVDCAQTPAHEELAGLKEQFDLLEAAVKAESEKPHIEAYGPADVPSAMIREGWIAASKHALSLVQGARRGELVRKEGCSR